MASPTVSPMYSLTGQKPALLRCAGARREDGGSAPDRSRRCPAAAGRQNPSTRPERRHRRHHQADLPHRRPDEAARGRGPRRHGRRDAEELSAPSGCAAPESRQWAAREPRSWLQGPSSTPTPISVDDHRRPRGAPRAAPGYRWMPGRGSDSDRRQYRSGGEGSFVDRIKRRRSPTHGRVTSRC